MKLHDLRPAAGSHTARTRVGRGISAGKGKTAGRGTKGQKARAGGSIPPWFEGGQTPLHMRIPKLRGFTNRFKTEYEVVNVGAIAAAAERGAFDGGEPEGGSKAKKAAPATVNQDVLRAVGLVRTLKKPLKILGSGELSTPLFIVADAFTKSAVAKIEAAGGTISVLEVPAAALPALGGEEGTERVARAPRTAAGRTAAGKVVAARAARDAQAAEDLAAAPVQKKTEAKQPRAERQAADSSAAGSPTPESRAADADGTPDETPAASAADEPAEAPETTDDAPAASGDVEATTSDDENA